jgi:hypothetical protein
MITIEKNIPIPAITRKATSKYPFADMETGDSFFTPHGTSKPASVRSLLYKAAKETGIKVTLRNETVDGTPGVRAWKKAEVAA